MAARTMMTNLNNMSIELDDASAYQSPFTSQMDEKEQYYEAGMREVLGELAKLHFNSVALDRVRSPRPNSVRFDAAQQEVEAEVKLRAVLGPDIDLLFDEYLEARNLVEHLGEEDRFIQGFIHGYQYLKQITASFKE
ncbi:hypothetical protein SAMN02799630_01197 [Paenibacillus sp. UNCCL117]|uniref:hypothetical protein n=1 Tax=unclassified Paenibacillus TaxID=185978 RepID=UPI00087F50B6|nr:MULTISPECIES: hypothetical protein [unclassified Paenibacillus]SDC69171.1 hypothetical protein SAMN04488602_103175 [Paenibacillus sp. cl123]SFW23838.1 hypothetical protein SAMN02799630_01197 [Paenibacillus sp. UNCCL117]